MVLLQKLFGSITMTLSMVFMCFLTGKVTLKFFLKIVILHSNLKTFQYDTINCK